MFFFFGISPKTVRHGFVMHDCTVHGGSAWHQLVTQRSYFTLFFVLRLFPVGGRHDLLTCTTCGATWQLPTAEAERLKSQARADVGVTPRKSAFGGLLTDVMRSWSPPPSPASSGPRRVQAERLDDPYSGVTHDPQQKVQWRPNR
ncbi:MAG: hypothetical protein JWM93_3812 [Frankiales bacterium]|nr:hypothetical protein [Frankiales bacterium]